MKIGKTKGAAHEFPLAELLQQIDRTYVLRGGRKLSYFGGCDYLRLASHPQVLRATQDGLQRFGLNVAASRKTTGNHLLYENLEESLRRFFAVESALLVSNGYMTNLAVAQGLAGEFTHALIDERAHGSLVDAAQWLNCPVIPFTHRDAMAADRASRQCGSRAKILLLTDGLFSHSGEVAPLADYLRRLPANTRLLMDDAHGAGILGRTGRGTAELLGVPMERLIQTITLSKAFGAYGGAILGPSRTRENIIRRSRCFIGNTPLPLPLAAAAMTALELIREDAKMRERLQLNIGYIQTSLREAGQPVNGGPGPILPLASRSARETASLRRRLLAAGIHPPFIHYPGGPKRGYFRFVISSEHTREQLDGLVKVLLG